jgi:LemA protein
MFGMMSLVVATFLVILILFLIATYNAFIGLKNSIKEAFATMDVYLKKRWDLVPNLVETVKGYAGHEKSTLEEIVSLRNSAYDKMQMDEKLNANKELALGLSKLFALAESYPDLKASQNFLDLSSQLSQIENDIANSRKYYNAVVREYNTKAETIPSNIVALLFGFKTQDMFEVEESQRENVQVKF